MKPLVCLILLTFISYAALAQQKKLPFLNLRTGAYVPAPASSQQLQQFNRLTPRVAGQQFAIIQFEAIPTVAQKKVLLANGIELLQYIPANAYTVSIRRVLSTTVMSSLRIRSVIPITNALKIGEGLDAAKQQEVLLAYFPTIPFDTVRQQLAVHGYRITNTDNEHYQLITVQVPAGKLKELAALPFVSFIDALPAPPVPLNFESRNASRAGLLQNSLPGGYNLTGEGVTIGIVEGASDWPFPHIDFTDRVVEGGSSTDAHATHVYGIVAGAGNVNERLKGYAPNSRIIGAGFSFNYSFLPRLANDQGMVLINHSYGSALVCRSPYSVLFGQTADKIPLDFPKLLHVYAAGNSGGFQCTNGFPLGYGTVIASPNSAKNVLTIGCATNAGAVINGSSRGPGFNGMIKPEITAPGTDVLSTIPNNGYGANTGTSMSSPAAVGGLALLNQRYRQLNGGQLPTSALMKAVIANTATDQGNPGPDYANGFGFMNLLRAVRSLDKRWYFADSIRNQAQQQHTIQVPAGTKQLKVMLYWHDAPVNVLSSRMVVNDLDLTVSNTAGVRVLPWSLDTIHANVQAPAIRAADHVNNIEQVTIENPAAGTYTINVNGTEIGQGDKQGYTIVYDLIDDKVELTFPASGNPIIPNEKVNIHWEDYKANTSTYKLEFSTDDGANWTILSGSIPATSRQFQFFPPSVQSTNARFRITRNDDLVQFTTGPVVLLGVPQLSLAPVQCPGYLRMQWAVVPEVDEYEVFMLRNGQMKAVATTTANTYTFKGLSIDSTYWVSVRARKNGMAGVRAVAVSRKPIDGTCVGDISDGDLKVAALVAPLSGRQFTTTSLDANQVIKVLIRNPDDAPSGYYSVKVNVNNSGWIEEQVNEQLAAGASYEHSFVTTYNMAAPGDYKIQVVVANDTLSTLIKQLPNAPIDLSTPFVDSFTNAVLQTYRSSVVGLNGADRFDYKIIAGSPTLAFSPLVYPDGTTFKAGMLFTMPYNLATDHHQMTGTYNLGAYDTSTHNIALRMKQRTNVGQNQQLYVRGSDSLPWIMIWDFSAAKLSAVGSIDSPFVNLGALLRKARQNYSRSLQFLFNQPDGLNQWLINQVDLVEISRDVQLISIDSMSTTGCLLSNAQPVYISVRNNGLQKLLNVPVRFRVDNGAIIQEVIPELLPDSLTVYRFIAAANLAAPGAHTLEVWTEAPNDNYVTNNTKKIIVQSKPLISAFPYFEDFDSGSGYYYVGGDNASWEYGIPASAIIKDAASPQKAWKTRLAGTHNERERSYLYSPCFDLSAMKSPIISFSMAYDMDFCSFGECESLNLQYSVDGKTWEYMEEDSSSFNWSTTWNFSQPWKVSTHTLPASPKLQLRWFFRSNNYVNKDGVAIDNIHIYDSIGSIYEGAAAEVEKNTSGNGWVPFMKDDKMVVAVNSHGQDLGLTTASVSLYNGAPRHFQGQYYLDRNWLITGTKPTTDSIGIRLYFLDKEADALIAANNCEGCTKPTHAHRFGVSVYSTDSIKEYNQNINDNYAGQWSFARARIVPFDKGYYAEFKVKQLAEFWLNNGGLDNNSYLPVRFVNFTAVKTNATGAQFNWSTASEINLHHFEIEMAKGNEAFEQGQYELLKTVPSLGRSPQVQAYVATDNTDGKEGVYYYRIKALDSYGNYVYSKAVPVVYTNDYVWQVFPNPAPDGKFILQYQSAQDDDIQINVYNATGSLVKQQRLKGNGFVQQAVIGLDKRYSSGVYWLRGFIGGKTVTLKLLK